MASSPVEVDRDVIYSEIRKYTKMTWPTTILEEDGCDETDLLFRWDL